MQRFEHVVVNQNGTFLPGVSVAVNIANATPGTGAAASLFSDEGITGTGNPATSDSNGRVAFYVADGKYDLTFSGVGITTYIRAALEIADMTGTTFAADVQGKFNTLAVSSNATVGGTLGVTGASTLANVTLGTANILTVSTIKQIALTSFVLSDPLGASHLFISGTSPYTNTFVQGNGSGAVFLGSASKTNVDDATGNITLSGATSGVITIKAPAVAGSNNVTFPAATDTLVGKATTDQFTNKTLTGVTTGNNVLVLNAQGATTAITGTGADAVIYTFTLLANTIDTTSKGIRITCAATHNSGTANPSVKININGVNVVTGNIGTAASQSVTFGSTILRTAATTGESAGIATVTGALNPFSVTLAGLAWTSNQTITMTFNVAATDQMTGRMFLVEQIQ